MMSTSDLDAQKDEMATVYDILTFHTNDGAWRDGQIWPFQITYSALQQLRTNIHPPPGQSPTLSTNVTQLAVLTPEARKFLADYLDAKNERLEKIRRDLDEQWQSLVREKKRKWQDHRRRLSNHREPACSQWVKRFPPNPADELEDYKIEAIDIQAYVGQGLVGLQSNVPLPPHLQVVQGQLKRQFSIVVSHRSVDPSWKTAWMRYPDFTDICCG